MAKKSSPIRLYDEEKAKLINPETLKYWKRYEVDMSLRELSENTIYSYRYDIFQWFIYVYDNQGNTPVTELEESDIEEFLFFCKKNGNNSRRIKRRMAAISAFYKFLRKKRIIIENPMEFIDRPKKDVDVTVQTYLTKEQVIDMKEKLAKNIAEAKTLNQKEDAMELRLYALISLSTMARVNAVRNIRWESIDFDSRMIKGVLEKEQKIVDLLFSKEVRDLLLELKQFREDNDIEDGGYVFPSVREGEYSAIGATALNSWCKRIGAMIDVPTLHPHDFRHSGATLLKNAGMSLEDVSSLLNHAGTDVTSKYYIKEDRRKIQAVKDQFEI